MTRDMLGRRLRQMMEWGQSEAAQKQVHLDLSVLRLLQTRVQLPGEMTDDEVVAYLRGLASVHDSLGSRLASLAGNMVNAPRVAERMRAKRAALDASPERE